MWGGNYHDDNSEMIASNKHLKVKTNFDDSNWDKSKQKQILLQKNDVVKELDLYII